MNVMGIIFTNDANLGELTNKRTTASIPFGGRYRQVDFHLSNMAAAGIRHIGQHLAQCILRGYAHQHRRAAACFK